MTGRFGIPKKIFFRFFLTGIFLLINSSIFAYYGIGKYSTILNPWTGRLDVVDSSTTLPSGSTFYIQNVGTGIDPALQVSTGTFQEIIVTHSGTVTRVSNLISSISFDSGRTLTISRNGSNHISSVTDGIHTWTFTRNSDDYVTSWVVSP